MPIVIGIDLGTQSLKAVACDEQIAVRGAHQIAYPTARPAVDRAEQDPADWEAALGPAIAGALAAAHAQPVEVVAIALAGQLDGCVAVDADGTPLHAALIWQDRRAVEHVALRDTPAARIHAITGQIADPSHLAPKLRWLRAHLAQPGRTPPARYHLPISFLVERLTGVAAIDPAHASTTMLYDLRANAWSSELLAAFAIDPRELPAILPTTAIAGTLHARGATLTGLPAGTPVAVGTGDDFATPLGAGLGESHTGAIACALGTAEVVGALAAAPILDLRAARAATDPWHLVDEPMVETHAFPTGGWFVEHPGWLSGGAIRWATRLLHLADDAELDALAASAPAGADGVTFVPALAGAMTPTWRPQARAALDGLAAGHDRAHVARAVLGGLAFASRDVVGRLAALGLPTREVLALGGGARSATWMQLRADALGLPHHAAARAADSCAVGAAMIAAVAVGALPDLRAACALAPPPAATYHPSPPSSPTRAALDEAYARYRRHVARLVDNPTP